MKKTSLVKTMSNFIQEYKNALSDEFCDHLIQKFEASPTKSPGRTGAGVDKTKKDSLDCYISQQQDWVAECNKVSYAVLSSLVEYTYNFPFLVTGAISPSVKDPKTNDIKSITHEDIARLDQQQIENIIKMIFRLDEINLQRYTKGKGGYHHWHSEHYPHPTDQTQKSLHRVLLWLVYLNDVEEGGETEFFYQDVKLKPSKGSLVLAPVNFTHTHRGCVPISNDKYVLASWINYNPANLLYGTK